MTSHVFPSLPSMTHIDVPYALSNLEGRNPQARETADMAKNCPYTVKYVSMGTDVLGVLVLPESKKWWADLQDNPELLGLSSLQVFFYSRANMHSPWSWVWSSQSWLSHHAAEYALLAYIILINARVVQRPGTKPRKYQAKYNYYYDNTARNNLQFL